MKKFDEILRKYNIGVEAPSDFEPFETIPSQSNLVIIPVTNTTIDDYKTKAVPTMEDLTKSYLKSQLSVLMKSSVMNSQNEEEEEEEEEGLDDDDDDDADDDDNGNRRSRSRNRHSCRHRRRRGRPRSDHSNSGRNTKRLINNDDSDDDENSDDDSNSDDDDEENDDDKNENSSESDENDSESDSDNSLNNSPDQVTITRSGRIKKNGMPGELQHGVHTAFADEKEFYAVKKKFEKLYSLILADESDPPGHPSICSIKLCLEATVPGFDYCIRHIGLDKKFGRQKLMKRCKATVSGHQCCCPVFTQSDFCAGHQNLAKTKK